MILDDIVAYKHGFVAHCKTCVKQAELKRRVDDAPPPAPFAAAIARKPGADLNVIAEVKKASPSKGIIREDFDPLAIAEDYAKHGAAAISVLTDEQFFKGRLDYLRAIHGRLGAVPLLRKDFVIDEYQVYEAREAGASAILLIVGILDGHQLVDYRLLAEDLGMAALTEVHTEREADIAAENGVKLLGVNNRDLRTFTVDLATTERIVRLLGGPQERFVFVAESGIGTPGDVDYLRKVGVDAILVGESFMRQPNPGEGIAKLVGR